jgi:hypothetical protein
LGEKKKTKAVGLRVMSVEKQVYLIRWHLNKDLCKVGEKGFLFYFVLYFHSSAPSFIQQTILEPICTSTVLAGCCRVDGGGWW